MFKRCALGGRPRPVTVLVRLLIAAVAPFGGAVDGQTKGGKILFAARQDIDTLDPHITNRAATRKILIQFLDVGVGAQSLPQPLRGGASGRARGRRRARAPFTRAS